MMRPRSRSSGRRNSIEEQGASSTRDSSPSTDSTAEQTGVRTIEAVSALWTKTGLFCAYLGQVFRICLMAFCTSLESQTVAVLSVYATSAFKQHSLISTVVVIQNVVNAVIKAPMAKAADAFGRLEAFSLSVLFYVIGYIQMAASNNVETYAAAQIFYSAGCTGLLILQQVLIADTTDLLNRALFSSLPFVPFLITVWIGPILGAAILKHSTWRWGYGIWTIVLPIAFLPLAVSLLLNQRKAARMGLLRKKPPTKGKKASTMVKRIWYQLDVMGIILLSAGIALLLIPLTVAEKAPNGWRDGRIIAMIVIGAICLIAFPVWETNKRLSPHPILSLALIKSKSVISGCGIAFFYFMAFYLSVQPYFYSYLQVVLDTSITTAGQITQTFSFTSTISAILTSLAIRRLKRYRPVILTGTVLYTLGLSLALLHRVEGSSLVGLVSTQICLGIGGGMLQVPTQLGVQASVQAASHPDVAAATAIFLTSLELGGAVGGAISGAVWAASVPRLLRAYLPASAQAEAMDIFGSILKAKSYAMGSPERVAINRAYQETMSSLLLLALCACVPLIPLVLLMEDHRLDQVGARRVARS
ncbi:MAG: hypothetical protein M1829_001908 [Trizodia sp. TS-e1964]|nr:MAG: hypothetical protein M1829_001908 [Trizodia sp. TS-e1964]